MNKRTGLFTAAGVALGLTMSANADLLFGIDKDDESIFTLDTDSGELIKYYGHPFVGVQTHGGLDFDSNGNLYLQQYGFLFLIDLENPENDIQIGECNELDFENFEIVDDVGYAEGGSDGYLYTIDLSTNIGTPLPIPTCAPCPPCSCRGTGLASNDGTPLQMYAARCGFSTIIMVDPVTGENLGTVVSGLPEYATSLAYGSSGNLWYIPALDDTLYSADPITGAVTAVLSGLNVGHCTGLTSIPAVTCPADINGDGNVDVLDLLQLLSAWGPCAACPEDINGDGIVDVQDLLELLASWGPCPGPPVGACCLPDGTCADMTEIDCMIAQGDWYEGEECATFTCPAEPVGACCFYPVVTCEDLTEYQCETAGGIWHPGEECATFQCPPCLYCDVCYTNVTDDWITNVTFNTINNTTGQDGPCSYGYYTYLSTDVAVGETHTISVTFFSEGQWTECVVVWIDWNQDCEFDQVDERYDLGCGVDATLTWDITVPLDAAPGPTGMRVMERYSSAPANACTSGSYGETEDYTVNVIVPPAK